MLIVHGGALKREPWLSFSTADSVDIRWETCQYTVSSITVAGYEATSEGMGHRAHIPGLAADTAYSYTVKILGKTVYTGTLRTPPASGTVRFIAIGSTGSGNTNQHLLALGLSRHNPHFVVHPGDVILPDGERANYDKHYFQIYGPVVASCPWYHVMAAHDYVTELGKPHWENFDKPGIAPYLTPEQKNYNFRVANIEFFMLDTWWSYWQAPPPGVRPSTGQCYTDAVWLEDKLSASTAQWKIVVHNATPYTCETTHGNELEFRDQVDSLFVDNGVQLSFAGLNRLYHRTDYVANGAVVAAGEGPVYITCGNGGAALYAAGPNQPFTLFSESVNGYVYCEINGANLTASVYGIPRLFAVDDVTDTFTFASHGFQNNHRVVFWTTGTLPGGISAATVYYIVGAAANTFQISLTQGGAAVDISAVAGTGRSYVQRRIDTWTQTA